MSSVVNYAAYELNIKRERKTGQKKQLDKMSTSPVVSVVLSCFHACFLAVDMYQLVQPVILKTKEVADCMNKKSTRRANFVFLLCLHLSQLLLA